MAIDFGAQDRWMDGLPSPLQYNSTSIDLGDESRWLNGLPSIIQYQSSGGAPVVAVLGRIFSKYW